MKPLAALVLAAVLAAPSALAQDQGPVVAVSSWKCDMSRVGDLTEAVNEYMRPAAQEMVDEGLITNWGLLRHFWGDEWNLVFYTTAADPAAVMEANVEMNRRAGERARAGGEDPEVNPLYRSCTEHKDSIYSVVSGAAPGME